MAQVPPTAIAVAGQPDARSPPGATRGLPARLLPAAAAPRHPPAAWVCRPVATPGHRMARSPGGGFAASCARHRSIRCAGLTRRAWTQRIGFVPRVQPATLSPQDGPPQAPRVHEGGGCRAFAGGDAADFPPALVVAHGEPDGGRFGSTVVQPGRRQAPIRQAGEARALRGCARGRRQVGDRQGATGAAASSAAGGAGWRQAAAARPTPNSANANHAGKRAGKRTGKRTKRSGILRSAIRRRKRPRAAAFFGVFQAVQRTIWFSSPLA